MAIFLLWLTFFDFWINFLSILIYYHYALASFVANINLYLLYIYNQSF